MAGAAHAPELGDAEFRAIGEIARGAAGLLLRPGKETLVRARLQRRLEELGARDWRAYVALVRADRTGAEAARMVDALTTNKTSFFREAEHFDYLVDTVLPALGRRSGPVRIWSAGCSTGEEAFTLAMLVRSHLPGADRRDVRILATDVSARVLATARAAVYADAVVEAVPAALRDRSFVADGAGWRVRPELRRMVRFARLNLQADWPMRGPFDAVFCRNVMIYFDRPTRAALIARFHGILAPGGHLFVGHSESLMGMETPFRYVRPAVYVR